ncbi:MAG: NAD-dependent deacylase [Balneolaceae bacterium]|nr:MAG: NAD-dependent deacylase [Balneolaceae bacterium]
MKHIVVLSGAGISAESGLATFRDSGGLWEGYDINDVATIEGWYRDKKRVLEFYNLRRKQAALASPNDAHLALKKLERSYKVSVITQNVDDLHERAGSSDVVHLHGMLREARSETDPDLIIDIAEKPIEIGDLADGGTQLRPNVVWFGEAVPMIEKAAEITESADIFIVVGTSLAVYPAASLVHYVKDRAEKYIIDPSSTEMHLPEPWIHIKETAAVGLPKLVNKLLQNA